MAIALQASFLTPYSMVGTIIIPILQMSKLRLRRIKCLAQGHTAEKWQSRYLKTCQMTSFFNRFANLFFPQACWTYSLRICLGEFPQFLFCFSPCLKTFLHCKKNFSSSPCQLDSLAPWGFIPSSPSAGLNPTQTPFRVGRMLRLHHCPHYSLVSRHQCPIPVRSP